MTKVETDENAEDLSKVNVMDSIEDYVLYDDDRTVLAKMPLLRMMPAIVRTWKETICHS